MKKEYGNPWGLSSRECDALLAVGEAGFTHLAAKRLGVAKSTVEAYTLRARNRMGVAATVQAVLMLDRHLRRDLPAIDAATREAINSALACRLGAR